MGIANVIEFGGVSSDNYGVIIEGPGEYTAPKRAFESISIPGRNGAFILDKGYYENVDGKFNAVIMAETQLEFQRKVRDFKNAIVSQRGYQRLTEQYHPDTYRMAAYKGGFDEEPEFIGKAAIFTLIFDCKPQRYLMSGESPIDVADEDIIFNPMLFDAAPLLEIGEPLKVDFNGYEIEIIDQPMGSVELQHSWMGEEKTRQNERTGALETFYDRLPAPVGIINTGDVITANMTAVVRLQSIDSSGIRSFGTPTNVYVTDGEGTTVLGVNAYARAVNSKIIECSITFPATYAFDDPAQSTKYNLHFTIEPMDGTGGWGYGTFECDLSAEFWQANLGGDLPIALVADITGVTTETGIVPATALQNYTVSHINLIVKDVRVESTADAFGDPTYVDCELGTVYKIVDGERISLNRYVSLGSELPVLSPGENVFAIDTYNADVKVIPRWCEV